MARATLTSANSTLVLTVPDVFPVPQTIQGYSTDDMFGMEAVTGVETLLGVDGRLSAGWIPVEKRMTITLQADSPSVVMFEVWFQSSQVARDSFSCDGVLNYPSVGRVYTMFNGFLTSFAPMPDARKILQPRRFQITWEDVFSAPV
jgi:hypothetical protein